MIRSMDGKDQAWSHTNRTVSSQACEWKGPACHYLLQRASFERLVEPQDIESLETVVFTQQALTF